MMAVSELAWAEELSHAGVTALLMLAVAILWRSLLAERKANSDYSREFITHVAELNQIPEAIDRLRTDMLNELRSWRK
jgi:hypothetical protein